MKKFNLHIFQWFSLVLLLGIMRPLQSETPARLQQQQLITGLQASVAFLGSDALQGRAVGSEGELRAAQYLADQLQKMGVRPANPNDSYFQEVPLLGLQPSPRTELNIHTDNYTLTFHLGEDYLIANAFGETYLPNPVPLVFAGYGIVAPEYGYDDYRNISAAGKIVVVLAGEPQSDDPDYFEGNRRTVYSEIQAKQRIALSRGAFATLILSDPRLSEEAWRQMTRDYYFEDVKLPYTPNSHPTLIIHPTRANFLFAGREELAGQIAAGHSPEDLAQDLAVRMTFRGDIRERTFLGKNVAGIIPGSDPELSNEYLILSAHYDHLGIGLPVAGDSIYNGVFDNAAGVGATLEIARSLAADPPARSVLVLFTTAEEKGLLGSLYYLDNPLVPLQNTVADINIDGLSMFDRFREVIGIGSHFSTLGDFLETYARESGLSAASPEFLGDVYAGFVASDQFAFAQAGIPSILVNEGHAHENLSGEEGVMLLGAWQQGVYHSPADDLQQFINWEAAAQHVAFLEGFTRYVADNPLRPAWHLDGPYAQFSLQTTSP